MSIYEHFRQEEHGFIDQVLQWKEDVLHQYSPKLTDFLDPREQQIVTAIVGTEGEVQVSFDGGQPFAERKRALLYPDYYIPQSEDFQLRMYELNYPKKFVTIEHPQVLGSAMSLGLRRSKFGDILVAGDDIQLVAAEEISSYIEMNLTSIGKAKVSLSSIQREQLHVVKEELIEHVYTVSSMNQYGAFSSFSNYGASVDVAAPGEDIVTTDKSGAYGTGTGTSMAAPHVAGLLLLRGTEFGRSGSVTGDPDSTPDPIASK